MGKSLNFCMVTTFYPPYNFGGDGIFIYRLSNELAKRGHHVDVLHCKDSFLLFRKKSSKAEYPNHPNVSVHGLKSRAGFLSPFLTQQTGMPVLKRNKIKSMLEDNKYDVIHFHNMSLMGVTAVQYGTAIKLYTMHEHWLVCPMHVLWRFNREVCTKRTCIRCQIQGKRPPQLWRYFGILPRVLREIDCFISPSRFTLNKHLELGPNVPIVHIPYFLPKEENPTDDFQLQNESHQNPYFLFVGRLEKIKGVQNLIPLFKEHPEYKLLIAGDGSYEDTLKNLAAGCRNIVFLGRLSHERLRDLYRQAIAVIVPSVCYEVFGIVIIESFAVKTPVIVNNLGALPEVIEDSGGGFVYNNQEELLMAMKQLAMDRELRNQLGEKGHQAYLKYWTQDYHLKKYLNLVEELQKKRGMALPDEVLS